jgi:hypothetical protein
MNKQPNIPFLIPVTLFFIIFSLIALTSQAAPAGGPPSGDVTIRGWLHAGDANLADAMVVVVLNEESCVRSILLRNGRFEFELPVGAKARLLFEKPGFLTKEVVVDTQNALTGSRSEKVNRNVKFDVVLESEEKQPERVYAGPVGSINFVKGTGTMRVRYDRQLVAAIPEE